MDTVQHLLIMKAQEYCDRLAIESPMKKLTYHELFELALGGAARLKNKYMLEDHALVVLICHGGFETILAMLSVLFARCIFMPITPSMNQTYALNLLRQYPVSALITDNKKTQDFFSEHFEKIIDADELKMLNQATEFDVPAYMLQDAISIFFSSGTTGIPQGVIGTNENLSHFVSWEITAFGLERSDRFGFFGRPYFDSILRDIFVPLCCGGTIYLNLNLSERNIALARLTVLHISTYRFENLMKQYLQKQLHQELRYILIAGDVLKAENINHWLDLSTTSQAKLINLYGITEATMVQMFYEIRPEDRNSNKVPLGICLPDIEVTLVPFEKEFSKLEIKTDYGTYLSWDDYLMRKKPRSYASNDLVTTTDNELYFECRTNKLVKINCIYVNLDEISKQIESHPNVEEATVEFIGNRLNAYYTSANILTPTMMYLYLRERLPWFSLPHSFTQLDAIVRLENGKIANQKSLFAKQLQENIVTLSTGCRDKFSTSGSVATGD